jgi:hypothetical protein
MRLHGTRTTIVIVLLGVLAALELMYLDYYLYSPLR